MMDEINKIPLPASSDSPVQCQVMRHREYIKAIQPYIKIKTDIYNMTIPNMLIHKDGTVEYEHNFTEQQELILNQIDECVEAIRSKILAS